MISFLCFFCFVGKFNLINKCRNERYSIFLAWIRIGTFDERKGMLFVEELNYLRFNGIIYLLYNYYS